MNKNTIQVIVMIVTLLVGAYFFQEHKVGEKFGRFITIMGNIAHNLQLPKHDYSDINITDEELQEVDIAKISQEMKAFIAKERVEKTAKIDKAEAKDKAEFLEATKFQDVHVEERVSHIKTTSEIAKRMDLKDLPEKLKPLKKFLHEPFKMGACQICHVVKPGQPAALVKKNVVGICYECHKTRSTREFDHKPVKDGDCMKCHDPHQSNTKSLLTAESVNDLCLKCHDKKSSYKSKAEKLFVSMDGKFKHKPAEKSCLECHEAHTADHKKLLKNEGSMKLCMDCHTDLKDHKDMKKWITTVKYKHGAVNDSKNKCLECHDPHSSNHKKILKTDQVKLCLSCHDKSVKSGEDGGMLMDIAKHLKDNPNWHKPIKDVEKEGGCAACHDPHGSDNFSILRKSFTKSFYDKVENKDFFCFECHEKKKISQKFVSSAENNITKFRDGTLNLHFLHVNDRKGRTCRACHDEHASKYPHLIRDYTDFTGVKFPLRFIDSEDGGSCAPACHKKFEYDRLVPQSKAGIEVLSDAKN